MEDEKKENVIVKAEESKKEIADVNERPQTELQIFGDQWRIATQLSKSSILPTNYQGHPENVIVAMSLAKKMDIDAFTVMQNLNIIKGKTAWSGSFCRTLIERSGKYENINLVYVGKPGQDDYGCVVVATRKNDGAQVEGPLVDMKMAKAEGWTSNSKWKNLPQLMLSYRAMSFFARVYCPEALNGIYTDDEIEDIKVERKEVKDVL